jgi:arylsulfatase A-like enzyme
MRKFFTTLVLLGVVSFLVYSTAGNRSGSRHEDQPADAIPAADGESRDGYSLILVTVDTLRADHLGCYGYSRDTSPAIDGLAERAILFENAVVSSPFTSPSHASMLTGLYPSGHGVLTNGYRFDDGNETLQEILRDNGYRTAAFVAARSVLGRRFGFDQGFELFSEGKESQRRAAVVNRELFAWLEGKIPKEKFFAWVHYYDAHCDYSAPKPFFDMFHPDYTGPIDPRGKCGKTHYNKMQLDEDDLSYIRALYDGEIRYVDSHVGALLTTLERLGLMQTTIVILTSDHGESLGDRGLIGHNLCLYDYEIRVPLIITHPRLDEVPLRIPQQVALVSLMPTVLEMLGIRHDAALDGRSFWPLVDGRERPEGFSYSQIAPELLVRRLSSIRGSDWKLILSPEGGQELYSLKNGEELAKLAEVPPQLMTRMKDALEQWIQSQEQRSRDKTQELSEEVREKLRALGYIN